MKSSPWSPLTVITPKFIHSHIVTSLLKTNQLLISITYFNPQVIISFLSISAFPIFIPSNLFQVHSFFRWSLSTHSHIFSSSERLNCFGIYVIKVTIFEITTLNADYFIQLFFISPIQIQLKGCLIAIHSIIHCFSIKAHFKTASALTFFIYYQNFRLLLITLNLFYLDH